MPPSGVSRRKRPVASKAWKKRCCGVDFGSGAGADAGAVDEVEVEVVEVDVFTGWVIASPSRGGLCLLLRSDEQPWMARYLNQMRWYSRLWGWRRSTTRAMSNIREMTSLLNGLIWLNTSTIRRAARGAIAAARPSR